MKRLTFSENGKYGVVGMDENNKEEKLYWCVIKLKNYEETGLSPDEVEMLRDFGEEQHAKLLAENARLENDYAAIKKKLQEAHAELKELRRWKEEAN